MSVNTLEVELIDKGGLKRDLSFHVPADAVQTAMNQACDRLSHRVRMPGFRPGHVPRHIVRSRFRGEIDNEIIQQLVPGYYQQALDKAGVTPAGSPVFSPLDITEGQPLKVLVSFEVQPEITLAPYDGLELPGFDLEVTDEDLAVAHSSLLNSMATLESAPKGHKAANGNMATIDFVGRIDGTPFPGGEAQGYALELGSGNFIPGFEEGILGHKAGDEFDIDVQFPADYHEKSLKGKNTTFSVTLHEVKVKALPELDDNFATQVGDFADLATLNETLRREIATKRQGDMRRFQRREAFSKLAELNAFDPPASLVEEELENMIEAGRRMATMDGRTNFDDTEARTHYRDEALLQVRGHRVVEEIAKAEGLAVSETDISDEVNRLAREYRRVATDVDRALRGNPVEMDRMRRALLKDKVLDLVISRARIVVQDRPDETVGKTSGKSAAKAAKKAAAKPKAGGKKTEKKDQK
ncbi:MAG: trigger factor [Nitrospirota bacterium]|nr:trigger factor [Nitrospirota bacterium]